MKKTFISIFLIIISITFAYGHSNHVLNEYAFAFEKLIVYYKDLEVGLQSSINIFINNTISSLPEDSLKEQLINEYTNHFTNYSDYDFLELALKKKSDKIDVLKHRSPPKSNTLDAEFQGFKDLIDTINTDITSAKELLTTASDTAADIKNEASKLNSSAKGDTTLKSISKHLKSQGNKLQKQVKKTRANMEDESNAAKFLNDELSQLFHNHDFIDDHHLSHHDHKGSRIDHYFNFILKLSSKISHLNLPLDNITVDILPIQQPAQNILNVLSTLDNIKTPTPDRDREFFPNPAIGGEGASGKDEGQDGGVYPEERGSTPKSEHPDKDSGVYPEERREPLSKESSPPITGRGKNSRSEDRGSTLKSEQEDSKDKQEGEGNHQEAQQQDNKLNEHEPEAVHQPESPSDGHKEENVSSDHKDDVHKEENHQDVGDKPEGEQVEHKDDAHKVEEPIAEHKEEEHKEESVNTENKEGVSGTSDDHKLEEEKKDEHKVEEPIAEHKDEHKVESSDKEGKQGVGSMPTEDHKEKGPEPGHEQNARS